MRFMPVKQVHLYEADPKIELCAGQISIKHARKIHECRSSASVLNPPGPITLTGPGEVVEFLPDAWVELSLLMADLQQ
jgi:hypothetical protein